MAEGQNGTPTSAPGNSGAAAGNSEAAPGNSEAAAAAKGPPLTVRVQYLKDMSFENPGAPATLAPTAGPRVGLSVDVKVNELADKEYEVVLTLRAEAKREETTVFLSEAHYGGVFAVGESVAKEHVQLLLLIEAPRLLFPFARSVLMDSIRDGGFPPLSIQPIDFLALYQQRVAKAREQQQSKQDSTASPTVATEASS